MHSALFVATIPPEREIWDEYAGFVLPKLYQCEGVQRLSENVWLLDLQKSVASLGWLVSLAEQRAIGYGLLPFEHAPEWLPAGFDPNTTQDRSVQP